MKIYLAGALSTGNTHVDKISEVLIRLKNEGNTINVLESFFCKNLYRATRYLCHVDNFMLDSGAFSFFNGKKKIGTNTSAVISNI